MQIENHIAAFTGHRTYDCSADDRLWQSVIELYHSGIQHFRVGMAEGFDLAAAEVVLRLKEEFSDVVLEAIVPWPEFARRFGMVDRHRYDHIMEHADIVRYAAERYYAGVYHRRNDMLVEGAEVVIAWWNGSRSGTEYTLRRAKRLAIHTINLYHERQFRLYFK